MKFVSWNVNGLRACIQKGFLEQFDKFDADFFCLQEIKLSEGQLELELPGYEQYWCYAEKKGYSGTAIFTKHTPMSVHYGLDVPELDGEGRLIALEYPEFYLITCYTPNAQRGLARIDHRLTWDDAFRAYLQELDAVKPVILCGDLNVAHQEIDLKNPSSNRGNAGFSDQERASFQKTLDAGFTDTFRHLHPDATGAYSWWSYMFHARENNAGWRIDYFLVSNRLQDAIYRAEIHSDVLGSDHCPVSVDLGLICNGGIWSPMKQGHARQLLPEVPTDTPAEKEPKASAGSAKALVALAAVFVLLLSAALLWEPGIIGEPGVPGPYFSVHVYSEPITHIYTPTTYPLPSLIVSNAGHFTDGTNNFYSFTPVYEATMSTYNTWVRVEATEYLLEQLETSAALSLDAPFGVTYRLELLNYYTDEGYDHFGGWLLFLELDKPMDFSIRITANDGAITETQTATLTPIESPGEGIVLDETELQITSFNAPVYQSNDFTDKTVTKVTAKSDSFEAYVKNLYLNHDLSEWNSWFFVELTDNAKKLLDGVQLKLNTELMTYTLDTAFSQLLYVSETYSDPACTNHTGWLVYGDLDTATHVIFTLQNVVKPNHQFWTSSTQASPYLSRGAAKAMDTAALMRFVTSHIGIQNDLGIYGTDFFVDAAGLRQNYPALDVLLDRDDAVSILMTTPLIDTSHKLTAHSLLELYLQDAMTPREQADFLTCSYVNAPYISFPITLPDPDIGSYTLPELIDKVITKDRFVPLLSECRSMEAAYYVFQVCQDDYYLVRLLSRQDAALQSLSELSSETPQTYAELYRFWQYLTDRQYAMSLRTNVLVDLILTDENRCSLITGAGSTLLQYSYSDPYLSALAEKHDAAEVLMNCAPADPWAKNVPKLLLEQMLLPTLSPAQAAQVITGLYSSAPEEFSFSLNFGANTDTGHLVGYLIQYGGALDAMFDRIPGSLDYYQVCYEIYNLLLPYSTLLQHLQAREDALSALRMHHLTDTSATSPLEVILYLYENYPITGAEGTVLALMNVYGWTEIPSAADGVFYAGSTPYIYSEKPSGDGLKNATFAYFVTVPQTLLDTYSEDLLSLSVLITNLSYHRISVLPCYMDAACTEFAGWLVSGIANAEANVQMTLTANNSAVAHLSFLIPLPD